MQNPASADHRNGAGRQVSFTLENERLPNYTDWMKHRVDSQQGKAIYSHHMSVVEPVFGNICTNKGLSRFSLRGRKKVQGQWQLYCLVHNIDKLANYGRMAAQSTGERQSTALSAYRHSGEDQDPGRFLPTPMP